MTYYKIISHRDEELLGIHKAAVDNPADWWYRANKKIVDEFGSMWWRQITTQTEYETYQAFGIKEIKL